MKFPKNPTPSPNVNPGIKNDRGRIILILIIGAIGYWVFSSWAGWQNTWEEIWNEVSTEIGSELESEFGIDIFEDEAADDSSTDTSLSEEYEPTYEYDPEPLPRTGSNSPLDFTTTSNTTIESDLSNEAARQILQDSRQEIIQQLRENGQEDQIPLVLQMLDEMEESY